MCTIPGSLEGRSLECKWWPNLSAYNNLSELFCLLQGGKKRETSLFSLHFLVLWQKMLDRILNYVAVILSKIFCVPHKKWSHTIQVWNDTLTKFSFLKWTATLIKATMKDARRLTEAVAAKMHTVIVCINSWCFIKLTDQLFKASQVTAGKE